MWPKVGFRALKLDQTSKRGPKLHNYAGAPKETLNQTSLEVPNSKLCGPKSGFQLPNLRFGTLKTSFCGALLRFLEVFEIHKLTPNLRSSWCKIIRLKVAQTRISKSNVAVLRFLQVFEIHKLKSPVKQTCHLGTLLGGDRRKETRISKSKVALLRFLQVFEIRKLKFPVKQTCHFGTLLGGDPRKAREPLKKWPFHKKNSQFFGLLSFSNFCTQNHICLTASNSRSGSP